MVKIRFSSCDLKFQTYLNVKYFPALGRSQGQRAVRKNLETWKSGSIFNFAGELFFFLHKGGGRLRDSDGVICPCPINTGPPGSAAGIQAAREDTA